MTQPFHLIFSIVSFTVIILYHIIPEMSIVF
nr:MAG TPA: Oligosaccaryltransferase [Caudoviricetes sp.]